MVGRFYGAAPNRLIGLRPNAPGRGRTDPNFKAGPFKTRHWNSAGAEYPAISARYCRRTRKGSVINRLYKTRGFYHNAAHERVRQTALVSIHSAGPGAPDRKAFARAEDSAD
jgi:hypothetical protein